MNKELEKAITKSGYKAVNTIEEDIFGRYHGIVANNNGDKFFVKAVVGTGSYRYRSLLSEVHVSQHLYLETKNVDIVKDNYQLFIPRTEKVIKEGEVLCLISDYIDGKRLSDQPSSVQAKMLIITLELMEGLSKNVQLAKIVPQLKTYTKFKLLLNLPLKLMKAFYLSPNLSRKLVKTAFKTFPVIFMSAKKTLVHADINASNIIFDNNKIYLTDWEEAGWGISEYNSIAPLSVHWTDKVIRESLLHRIRERKNPIAPLLAYRTLVLLNQKIDLSDSRRIRDLKLLNFISSNKV